MKINICTQNKENYHQFCNTKLAQLQQCELVETLHNFEEKEEINPTKNPW